MGGGTFEPDDAPPFNFISPLATCTLVEFRIYISTTQPVAVSEENFWKSVLPSESETNAPVSPDGTFYVITAVWDCAGVVVESAPSNQINIPGGPTLDSNGPKVSSKIKTNGSNFTSEVNVFIDSVGFVNKAKVKQGGTQVIQKGNLIDGRSIPEAIPPGKTVLMCYQNNGGGISCSTVTKSSQ
jgi:hypothetical protein